MERNIILEGGYTEENTYIRDVFDILREWSDEMRSKFLFFVTGKRWVFLHQYLTNYKLFFIILFHLIFSLNT
jgi:hypothetical protein